MLTVVLDANILVSALLTPRGEGAAVLERARAAYLVTRNIKYFPRSYAGVTIITPKEFFAIAMANPEER